ncbi:hypothetical protein ES332_D05G366000v1 [Gossypium tomentosum]|uniref:Secreted protein n=1 Tax=Gossypium tomentosum TaxID=34277 RepID=A0A5D2L3Z8_GOSTO|nr:hypothetical protein ES332_D05G366000v1 [Gossypium tomentosum]
MVMILTGILLKQLGNLVNACNAIGGRLSGSENNYFILFFSLTVRGGRNISLWGLENNFNWGECFHGKKKREGK